ncbi:MAG: hypothetical protein ACPLKQ_05515 [Candidatus Bathyarchaeales archaeon]
MRRTWLLAIVLVLVIVFLAGSYFIADYNVTDALSKIRVNSGSMNLSLINQTRIIGVVVFTIDNPSEIDINILSFNITLFISNNESQKIFLGSVESGNVTIASKSNLFIELKVNTTNTAAVELFKSQKHTLSYSCKIVTSARVLFWQITKANEIH